MRHVKLDAFVRGSPSSRTKLHECLLWWKCGEEKKKNFGFAIHACPSLVSLRYDLEVTLGPRTQVARLLWPIKMKYAMHAEIDLYVFAVFQFCLCFFSLRLYSFSDDCRRFQCNGVPGRLRPVAAEVGICLLST